jgi:apolipoprotein N-acyltransferase
MAFAPDAVKRGLAAAIPAIAASAALLWFGTGLEPMWPLVWLAPVPVLVFAARASWGGAAAAAAIAWLLGQLNLWHYLHGALHVPAPILAQIYGGEALAAALGVLLYRALIRRGAPWSAILGFAALRVVYELGVDLGSPHGTAGSLAYSQLGCLPLLQLASVTGLWGVAFVATAIPAALAATWQLRATPRRALRVAGIAGAALAIVLGLGAIRLAGDAGPTVRVGLIASDPPTSPAVADDGAPTAALLDSYALAAERLATEQRAAIVVLPEKLGVVTPATAAEIDARFQAIAERTGAVLIAGVIRVAPPVKYNEARIYARGAPVATYAKRHMLPPFESMFAPGTELALRPGPHGPWGVAICKDMDFTPLSRDYGRAGTALLLVPAWDFVLDRSWHGHMAILRGVENGFAIARAAKQGYLTVSDNRGRILAETASDAAPFTTLVADVPAAHAPTLYARLGDWFAWLALALLAAALLRLLGVVPLRGRPAG